MELLSYPLPRFLGGQGSSGQLGRPGGSSSSSSSAAERQQHYGVRLRVAGSGWTQPLALDVVEANPAGGQQQQQQQVR